MFKVLEEKGKLICMECKREVVVNPIETEFGYFIPCPRCRGTAYEGNEKPKYINTPHLQRKKNYYFVE